MNMAEPSVPPILHQTWKTADVPAAWRAYAHSWREMHPGWEYRLWTDEANRAFIAEYYPRLLPTYDGYTYGIQRADAVRYCLLHHFGGVYADLDIECLQPIDGLIARGGFQAALEPVEQGLRLGQASLLSNAFMISPAGHPLLAAVIDALIENPARAFTHRHVLETTGPLMLDRVFRAYAGDDVLVLPGEAIFPYPAQSDALRRLQRHEDPTQRAELVAAGTFAVHYWANSWVGTLAGELVNPDPEGVEGYEFFRGWDSPGNDIANGGRDIRRTAIACSQIDGAVAFNTDGFVKKALLPRAQWQPMGNGAANEGLYVKKPERRGILRRLPMLQFRR
jgi:hypothetical protein